MLDHAIVEIEGAKILIIHIPEAPVKPVHIRGKAMDECFIRSGATTRKASRQEVGTLLLHSRTPRWEELRASLLLSDAEILEALRPVPILKMLDHPIPNAPYEMIEWLESEKFVIQEPAGGGYITNLGAIAAASDLKHFPDLARKAVRMIVYDGLNKSKTKLEREGKMGYALGFRGLLNHVSLVLPQSEEIQSALRTSKTVYPEDALRELIANALIHQDFSIQGTGPMVEIFDDRIEISNPGGILPSKQLDRLRHSAGVQKRTTRACV